MRDKYYKTYIDDYLTGRLSPKMQEEFKQFLNDNPKYKEAAKAEEKWLELLRSDEIPDPGENYWQNVEENIIGRVSKSVKRPAYPVEKDREKSPIGSFLQYFLPAAAAVAALLIAIATLSPVSMPPSDMIAEKPVEEHYFISAETKLCLQDRPEPIYLQSIIMLPPGSAGGHIYISRMTILN